MVGALDVDKFWTDGWAILPGLYSAQEIQDLRRDAYASKGVGGDLLAKPKLRRVLTDGRLVAVARKLLGSDAIHYGGDSSLTINGTQRGFHKDNADRVDGNAPDWDGRYTQLRFGIYCQDHTRHTGGLNLRDGSHDIANLTDGKNVYVKVKPGDLAVWSMRITHSGNGTLLRAPFDRLKPTPLPTEHDAFKKWMIAPPDGDRIAIFAHLGAVDSHAQRYGDYLKTRKYMVDAWRKLPYDDEAREAAKAAGLTLRDMPAEVMDDPDAGKNVLWQAIPY
ncbi:hypothetical protein FGL98_16615 [Leekyejoonella antrihumi]|uniref:Phytanoyl-CoA dioxygenase family protein n=1 Tax=Leekyejoonella antrihumi TaxID=1660198 RepID=A0A563DXP5_9MICO|nr:hypothetical protein FGL98_16615 [Leekyejoonella antrihumi]